MGLDERLNEIFQKHDIMLIRSLDQVSYGHPSVENNRKQAIQDIKEAVCEEEGHKWDLSHIDPLAPKDEWFDIQCKRCEHKGRFMEEQVEGGGLLWKTEEVRE